MAPRAYDKVVEKNGYKFIRLDSGRLTSFWDNITGVDRVQTPLVRFFSRAFKLATDDDIETLERRVEDLGDYVDALRKALETRRAQVTARQRIASLRNTHGRTKAEAAEFLRKADQLERQLEEEMS